MFRATLLSAILFSSTAAFACPMQDAAAFAAASEAVQKSKGTKVSFLLSGLTCGDCSDKVQASLKKVEGVILSAVDYQTGRVEIAFNDKKTDKKKLEAALVATGYKLVDQPS